VELIYSSTSVSHFSCLPLLLVLPRNHYFWNCVGAE